MKSRLFVIIAFFIGLSIGFGSCVGSSDPEVIDLSTDASVTAFGLEAVGGRHYKFTIDQLRHVIFNEDSLPVQSDTLLKEVTIDTFNVSGYLTSGLTDTLFSIQNKQNLLKAINNEVGIMFKVVSLDGSVKNDYTLYINMHKQVADSLNWQDMGNVPAEFSKAPAANGQRLMVLDNTLLVYTQNNGVKLIKANISNPTSLVWSAGNISGLPNNAVATSITKVNGKLYAMDGNGKLYTTDNGEQWQATGTPEGTSVKALLAQTGSSLSVILNANGTNSFATYNATNDEWQMGEVVPANFPTGNMYHTTQISNKVVERTILVGTPQTDNAVVTPWLTMEGLRWTSLDTVEGFQCKDIKNPMLIYYNDTYYIFGNELKKAYASLAGLAWKEDKSFALPKATNGATPCALAIDDDNFIWVSAAGKNGNNKLYRGRLNKFGFKRK